MIQAMAQSIRWRLVMGMVLLTLLTVSAVGVMALLLMQRYMIQQERAYLSANAQAIAEQAAPFMSHVPAGIPLQQLAQTAAFLGDVTVRIVDGAQNSLADSGASMPLSSTVTLAAPALYFQIAEAPAVQRGAAVASQVIWSYPAPRAALEVTGTISLTNALLAQQANVIMVQRSPSFWGDRLTFETSRSVISATLAMTQTLPPMAGLPMTHHVVPFAPDTVGWAQAIPADDAPLAQLLQSKPVAVEEVLVEGVKAEETNVAVRDVVTAPIRVNGSTIGFVEVGRAVNFFDEPLSAIRRALGIAAGASALLAIAVGLVMSHTLTAPIHNLAQAAAAMSSGDLTARAPVIGRDELAALARQFNQMADALHRSFAELAAERDTLRRFVADASHELRTPITALRTFNELLQGAAQADRAAQAEFLAESQLQIARLEWITRNLLDLSRWDGGMATLALAQVEIGELVATTAAPFRTVAQERGVALTVITPEVPVVAMVDEQRLAMAVSNLLDNAVKFTSAGGTVEVGVCQEQEGVRIWVADTGMGISAEDFPHIFERFYRSPRSTQVGSGLGLAIVERIVRAHGATIHVDSEEGVGSRFTLCFN